MQHFIYDHNAGQIDTVGYDSRDEAIYAAQAHKRMGRLRRWSILTSREVKTYLNRTKEKLRQKPLIK